MGETSTHSVVYRSCNLCEAHCGVAVTVDRALAVAEKIERGR